MITNYTTIQTPGESEIKEKGSKFIGFVHQVRSEEDVKEVIDNIRSIHPKSRHICYAFSIGTDEPLERANDDGEPSGSAGRPILGQIHSNELHYTLVAVVRYFGGTLLGVPGLIAAYKGAAAEAIANAKLEQRHIRALYQMETDHMHYHELMNYLKRNGVDIIEQDIAANCIVTVAVEVTDMDNFNNDITLLNGIKGKFTEYEK